MDEKEELIKKEITDLGAAAYLMMHGYEVAYRWDKAIVFEITEDLNEEFDNRNVAYLKSEFHRFDSCIMSLKKFPDKSRQPSPKTRR